MLRRYPLFALYMLIVGALALTFTFILTNLPPPHAVDIPPWTFRLGVGIYAAMYGYWIIDLLLSTERRGVWQIIKGRIAIMIALTVILYVYPCYWYGTLPWPTLWFALAGGVALPSVFFLYQISVSRMHRLSPEQAENLARHSNEARRFLERFPNAAIYAYGLSEAESERMHVLYHHREHLPVEQKAFVDYCMDIPIDSKLGRVLGGTEKLKCYLCVEQGEGALVSILPATNIGYVLDAGYTESVLEDAYTDALDQGASWPILGERPLPIHSFSGRAYKIR